MCAAENGHTETAEVLLREGADVSVQEKVHLRTCTHVLLLYQMNDLHVQLFIFISEAIHVS